MRAARRGGLRGRTPAPANGRTLYKWVDEQGVTHYGDHIPPEYAAQEQHVINSQGVEIEPPRGAEDPRAAGRRRTKEDSTREQRANRDKNLLNTYASVQEIERLRDQRLTLLADQIKVTEQFLEVLNGKHEKAARRQHALQAVQQRSQGARPCRIKWPRIWCASATTSARRSRTCAQKRSEEATMSKQFESDIDRFKELKGIH